MKEGLKEKGFGEAFVICLLPVLLYGVIGPLEIYAGNADEFIFILNDFFYIFLAASAALLLIFSFVLVLLPKKLSEVLKILIFAFSVLSYLQNIFLNIKLMDQAGGSMDWADMRSTMIGNLVVWIVIAALIFAIPIFYRKKYRKLYFGISAFLSAVQIVAIISLILQTAPMKYTDSTMSLTGVDQFKVAPNDNIIFLVLDSFDNTTFEACMQNDPEIADTLKDFTYFNNADCHYNYTYPSILHILTGSQFSVCETVSQKEWISGVWHEPQTEALFGTLRANDYICDIYFNSDTGTLKHVGGSGTGGSVENLEGIIDNVYKTTPKVRTGLLVRLLEKMTIYKYAPYILKPVFEVTTQSMGQAAYWTGSNVIYDNGMFYERLTDEGLSVDRTISNKYSFLYLQGLHEFFIDENCRNTGGETTKEETAAGLCVLIKEFVSQLQELGIYDRAVIIILADHGKDGIDGDAPQPMFLIKVPYASQDDMIITSAPISYDDIVPTLLGILGQDYSAYGTSVFDWSDGDRRRREVWFPERKGENGLGIDYSRYVYDTDRYELLDHKGEATTVYTIE